MIKRLKTGCQSCCQGCWNVVRRKNTERLLPEEKCILTDPMPFPVSTHYVNNGQLRQKTSKTRYIYVRQAEGIRGLRWVLSVGYEGMINGSQN